MMRLLTYICVVAVTCIPSGCLEFHIDRTSPRVPGAFCAMLSCQENLASDPVTYSLVNMSIYRESRDRMLLASLTEVEDQLRHQGHTGVKVNGSIGKSSADMEVLMSVTSYCQDTAFVCQVMFADDKGQIGVREKVVPPSTRKISANNKDGVTDTQTITTTSQESRSLTRAIDQRRRRSSEQLRIDPSVKRNTSLPDDEEDKKKTDTFNQTPQIELKTIEEQNRRLVEVQNMLQILDKKLGISKNKVFTSDVNELGRFIEWPFSLAEFVSQPKQIKCERNMNFEYPKMILVQLGNGKVVLCDTKTDGGGWIVMQRRIIGDVDFNRGWHDYKHGFGSYNGDFWLGNELVSSLTSEGHFELRVEMKFNHDDYVAVYDGFKVEGENLWYKLRVGGPTEFSFDDYFDYYREREFYTYDRDGVSRCATRHKGGWWNEYCHGINPNGPWNTITWYILHEHVQLSRIEFKFRRRH
ncbi:fibrinogen beta chain-like isoform X2 [Physella acuta]|uniref:fibrinogen beta chain-like isoform X2 n=1 Tax=Physella acuta TaxID=109671 RepID=UPI0027DBE162|nr:fibrinogen beta chain-like isoform X2 [Physella acuta]